MAMCPPRSSSLCSTGKNLKVFTVQIIGLLDFDEKRITL
jgi:hypothetical protein